MTDEKHEISVLFVCMGNICRSPTAEGVFRKAVDDAGLANFIRVDSAGTHAYHSGERPDKRARAAAERRGYALSDIRARRIDESDYSTFNYIVAMDRDNLEIVRDRATPEAIARLCLFLDFSAGQESEVPDPYYGGPTGFERVLDLVEEASLGLLKQVRDELNR